MINTDNGHTGHVSIGLKIWEGNSPLLDINSRATSTYCDCSVAVIIMIWCCNSGVWAPL